MTYGGFWIRFLAYVVDSVIVTIAIVVITLVTGLAGGVADLAGAIASFLVAFLYWPLMHASARQATFGKALVGLKVAGPDDGRLSILRSLVREIAKILSWLPLMIGFVLAAFTGKKQALHDFIATTTVVRAEKGHVVPALAVAVLAVLAPVLAAMTVGASLVAGLVGAFAGAILATPEVKVELVPIPAKPEAPKPAVAAPAPTPKPAAPAPAAAPVAAAKPAAPAPKVVAIAAPVVLAQAEPPKLKTPAPEPAKVDEPPKVEEAAKPEPAPAPKPVVEAPIAAPRYVGPVTAGPKYSDLATAVLYRDVAGVEELIRFGRWVDKPDSRGRTPLMTAVGLGDAAVAEALLKAGADPGRAMATARETNPGLVSLLQRYSRATP